MGVVYAAHDERLDRPVAITRIRPGHTGEHERHRFRREARAAASVSHPNVCQLYEIDEDAERLFLSMELLDGEPLDARLERGALPADDAVQIALTVLAALAALHQKGVVHRDLKPSNIFLSPHGVKRLDFGLARPFVSPADSGRTAVTLPGRGFYHWAGALAQAGDPDGALGPARTGDTGGFHPAAALARDPRFDRVRPLMDFQQLVRRGEGAAQRGLEIFRRADGPRLLGPPRTGST